LTAYHLQTPLTRETLLGLRIGDEVFLTGTLYVARDAAHRRFLALLAENQPLPVDLRNEIVFYAGPTPAQPWQVIGAIAPTTASRMDPYAVPLFQYGVAATIGKGPRGEAVKAACEAHKAVCFSAVGGLSAVLSEKVREVEVVAYEDLGPEAVRRIVVDDFPVLVVYDTHGGDLYEQEIAKYRSL
jgi:fumarate hydratase subunit beta